ncbi:MAG: hypothetical protein M1415_01775 [Firmicutes bacterium]|nr:hypothetical protein [Bacillota bacterium]MCL5064761.1 hypothetical protein [Bacillota bacterium]
MEALKQETVLKMLKRRVNEAGIWLTDGTAVYAAGAKAHHADHWVTLSSDPDAAMVFHWINTVINLAKTFIDGTYHRRRRLSEVPEGGRARRQPDLEEFTYRCNRRYRGTRIADRLLMACETRQPHLYGE